MLGGLRARPVCHAPFPGTLGPPSGPHRHMRPHWTPPLTPPWPFSVTEPEVAGPLPWPGLLTGPCSAFHGDEGRPLSWGGQAGTEGRGPRGDPAARPGPPPGSASAKAPVLPAGGWPLPWRGPVCARRARTHWPPRPDGSVHVTQCHCRVATALTAWLPRAQVSTASARGSAGGS